MKYKTEKNINHINIERYVVIQHMENVNKRQYYMFSQLKSKLRNENGELLGKVYYTRNIAYDYY